MKFWRRLGDVDPRRDASSCTPLAQNHSDFWRFRFLEAALNLRVVGSIPTRLTSLRLLALPLCASYGWQAKEGCSPRAPKLSRKAEAKAARRNPHPISNPMLKLSRRSMASGLRAGVSLLLH